jgi:hypothetical protein
MRRQNNDALLTRRRPRAMETAMNAKSNKLIQGATGDWEVVIGLEVHAQVTS